MKKLSFLLLFAAYNLTFYAQTWVDMMQDPNANFYETQEEFNAYWDNRPYEKGKGYKQFRRWENYMEPRVFPRGDVKVASKAYEEFVSYKKNNPTFFIPNTARSTGNWTQMGPVGAPTNGGAGRINFVRFMPGNTTTMFVGSPAGGLWKTTNGGTSWTTNTDQLSVIGCTDIAIDPANTNIMYLATGDGEAGDTYSIGVLKSTDGGTTWLPSGLTWTVNQGRTISKLLIHPTNSSILLAATSNGVYRTTDAGATWTQVRTGNFKDMEFKPGDPNTVYVSGTTFWKSINNGQNWTQVTSGLPTTGIARMALAVTPANSAYVYMLVARSSDNGLLGVYRSTDNGTTFTQRIGTSPNLLGWNSNGGDAGGQGWYDLAIAASETNADVVVVGGVNMWRSTNGGTNWTINGHWTGSGAPYVHADIHDIVFLPGSGTTYYSGNDGGIFRTTNSGTGWSDISANLTIAQQYRIGGSTATQNLLVSGHQDNGTNKMTGTNWAQIYGGDGMDCFIDRTNDNRIIASYVYGDFQRSTNGGGTWTTITTGLTGTAAWNAPIHQDPVTANTFYCGYQHIFKSTNSGTNWTQLAALPVATGSVVEFDVAPSNVNYIYVVKSNNVFKSTNGGTSWTTITTGLPTASAAATNVEIHPTNPDIVWVTFSGYSAGNKVFMTTNGGTNWTNYSTGLPNLPANCIIYQNSTPDALYLGTDVGVYYRDNTLSAWQPYMTGLPNVVVTDFEIYYPTQKLRAGTFGRGSWESDLFTAGASAPIANFNANRQVICQGQQVNFTDASSFAPTSWSWTFTGGTPATSTAQNPTVTYSTPGTYQVVLTATNANGSDTKTEVGYITVTSPQVLPLVEGFQGTFAPAGWVINDVNGNSASWLHATSVGGFGTSTSCTVFDNYNTDEAGARDEFWTPKYAFTSLSSATLTFDVAYARYNATYSDSLAVLVSTDCGLTFTQLFLKGGTTLSTAPDATTLFTPTAAQWRTETISLNSYTGQANVMIAFQNRGRYGNAIFVDNVNITGVVSSPAPVADFSATPTTVCVGQTVAFTDLSTGGPTSWSWSFTGGTPNTSTVQNPTITYNSAGTYAVSLTATNGSGSDTETKTAYISVNANPTATATANSPLCAGTTLNLSTPAITGATYAWTGPGGYTATTRNPSRTNVTTAMSGTYTVTVTNGGCSATSSVNVVVNAAPTATASSNGPLCVGATLNLSTPTVTGATYAWSGPGGYTSTVQNPTRTNITTAMAGTYTVTVTNAGCTSTSSVTVVINTLPTATASSNGPLCAGATLNLSTPAVTGATYAWAGPGGYTSTLQNPSRTNVTTAMAGTYTVTVTNGGCSATSSVTVVINASPTATATSNGPLCAGATLNLTTPAVTGATYAWTGPNSFTSTSQNPTISNVTTAMAGTYSVTVTNAGCSATSSVTVVISAAPTASAASNGPICSGATLNLTTTTVTGATYAWTGPGGYTSTTQNPTRTNATTAMAGTYTVTVTNGGCTATSSVTVVINASPTATATANGPLCAGGTLNLSTPAVTGATYSWTGPGGYTSTTRNPSRTNVTTAMAGTYTVIVTNGGCTATSSVTVVITAAPTATATANSPLCSGSTLNLSTPAVTGATYAWTGPGGYTSTTRNPSRTNVTTAMAGTYTVTVTNGGCTATSSVTVVINASPTATATANGTLCAGATLNLSTPAVTGATYAWTGPNSFTSTVQNPTIASTTTAMAGTYTVTVTNGGCTATSSVTVAIGSQPTAIATSNGPLCSGATLNLFTPTVAGSTYAWTGPNSFTSTAQNPTIASTTTAIAGTYTVTVTNGGCTATSSVTVVINASPTATATSNGPLCTGTTLNLSTPAVTGATYAWTGPGGYTATTRNPSRTNVTTAMAGTYTVTVTNGGCTATSSVTVVITSAPTATATANSPLCSGSTLNLSTPAVTGATYAWTGPGGYTSTTRNPSRTNVTTAMAGTYTVTVTNGGCTATSSVTVVINASPTATASANGPLCTGATLNLSTPAVTGATYAWTGPGGYTSTTRNPSRTNVTTAMAGTYTVTVTNGGCTATSSVTVVINTQPTATASSNTPLCEGATLNLSTPAITGATYAWTGQNSYTSSTRNPSITNVTTGMTGTYTVTVTNGSCTATSSVNVVVNASPTALAGSNGPLCEGATLNLNTPTVATATYAWTGPNGFNSSLQNPTLSTITTAMAGTYNLTVTLGSCSSVSSVVVVINPAPTALAAANTPLCSGETLNLSTSANTGATYAWSGPNGFTDNQQNPSISNVTTIMSGMYEVNVTIGNCSALSTVNVVVNETPTANATSNGPICEGNTLNLSTTNQVGASYAWTGPNGFTSSLSNPTITSATSLEAGLYTVVTTIGSCSSTSSVQVDINAAVPSNASSNSPICEGGVLNLTTPAVFGATYSWTGPNGFTSNVQNPILFNATANEIGSYTVVVTTAQCGLVGSTSSTSVNVLPLPAAPIITYVGGILNSNQTSGNQWYLDGEAIVGEIGVTHTPISSGTYTVTYSNGECTSQESNEILLDFSAIELNDLLEVFEIYPNPNNGTFIVMIAGIKEGNYSVDVLNTIGQTVYSKELGQLHQTSYQENIDLSYLSRGIYFFRISSEGKSTFKKFIVQ